MCKLILRWVSVGGLLQFQKGIRWLRSNVRSSTILAHGLLSLSIILQGCAINEELIPAQKLSDVNILVQLSNIIHSSSSIASSSLEDEITSRHLLNVREVEEAQSSTFKVGIRSNVLLAAFGKPSFVIVGPSIPGIQVWRYTKIFADFNPLDADSTKSFPVRWQMYNPSYSIGGGPEFFIKDGIVIGFVLTAPHKDRDSDPLPLLHIATAGYVPYIPANITPPMSIFFCAMGTCDDALMTRRD